MVELRLTIGGLDRFHYGLHSDAFHLVFVLSNGPCFPVDDKTIRMTPEDRLKL
jgi:hypothetical protein